MGVSTIKGKRFLILFLGKGPNHPILSPSGEWNVSRCQLASGHKPPAPSLRACLQDFDFEVGKRGHGQWLLSPKHLWDPVGMGQVAYEKTITLW